MEYRECGASKLRLSVIGTGCWSFGGGEYWGVQDQKDAREVVHASVDAGINYFDTAEVYNEGRSESSLGEAMKGISRDRMMIGTKVSPSHCYAGMLEEHCEASLKRLQTDYIDLYMIHWPIHPHSVRHFTKDDHVIQNPPTMREAFDSLARLQKAGKIRYIGMSNFSGGRLKEDIPDLGSVVVNELPYNLLCRAIEYETMPFCAEQGIGVIGYITLLQGILTGKYAGLSAVPSWQRRTRHFNSTGTPLCRHGESGFEQETARALADIRRIAEDIGMKMGALATKWVLANKSITTALVGARNRTQLIENVGSASLPLDPSVISRLNECTEELKNKLGNHFDYYESAENDRTL